MIIEKGDIVKIKINHYFTILVTKILNGYYRGINVNTQEFCEFTPDTIVKKLNKN